MTTTFDWTAGIFLRALDRAKRYQLAFATELNEMKKPNEHEFLAPRNSTHMKVEFDALPLIKGEAWNSNSNSDDMLISQKSYLSNPNETIQDKK